VRTCLEAMGEFDEKETSGLVVKRGCALFT